MQANELLERHDLKEMVQKTKISEENITALLNKDFGALTKVKTLGFISIIEREYKVDLSALRKEAKNYFEKYGDESGGVFEVPLEQNSTKKGLFGLIVVIAVILTGIGWYVLQQSGIEWKRYIPFVQTHQSETVTSDSTEENSEVLPDLSSNDTIENEDQ